MIFAKFVLLILFDKTEVNWCYRSSRPKNCIVMFPLRMQACVDF